MEKIKIDYYKLIDEKQMGDGGTIPKNQELILIKEDKDGLLFFETHNDEYKKLFWSNKKYVDFIKSSNEEWDDEKINKRNRYINGEFL